MATKNVGNRRQGERRRHYRRRADWWACTLKNATKVGAIVGAFVLGWAEVQKSNDQFWANRELVQKAEAERAKREADERLRALEEQLAKLAASRMPVPEPAPGKP